MADSDSRPRDSAIFLPSADLLEILARSSTNASPSRTAAYWLMIAKIPVTAATPIARYLAPSFADVNLSKPLIQKRRLKLGKVQSEP
jgi:hypothetical protein